MTLRQGEAEAVCHCGEGRRADTSEPQEGSLRIYRQVTSNCKDKNEERFVSEAGEQHREESSAVLKDNMMNKVTRKEMEGGTGERRSEGVASLGSARGA